VQLDTSVHLKLGDVLLDVLEIEDDPVERMHLFELLGDYIQEVVWEQKYADASAIIVELTQIVSRSQSQGGTDMESLANLIEDLATNVRAHSSQKWFTDSFQTETSALLDLLKLLGPSATPVLIDLVPIASGVEQKTLLRNALCSAASSDISALRDGAANRNPRIAAEVARVVGKLRDPAGAKVLEPAIDHEDPTVRLEAARALGQIGGPESSSLLSRLLKDPDEEVRIEAANTIDVSRENVLSHAIADMVASRAFKRKTTREKMALVKALKKASPGDVVAAVAPFLRGGLFGKREEDAVVKSMINALALIHTDAAQKVLELGSRSSRKTVSTACIVTLSGATGSPANESERHEYQS
jgi:hypothetical protein